MSCAVEKLSSGTRNFTNDVHMIIQLSPLPEVWKTRISHGMAFTMQNLLCKICKGGRCRKEEAWVGSESAYSSSSCTSNSSGGMEPVKEFEYRILRSAQLRCPASTNWRH
eukprot:5015375-Pleurochrysis_carterae.AAC.1